jgi:hypothetical protein
MTCREFKRSAASLTLWELSPCADEQVLDHAEECPKCGAWLDRQRMLAASMQTLQAQTAGRQAGPQVERALLRMFRQEPFEATQPVAAHRSAPIAFRLSRFFEVGAYVAVAAAIVVGLFLGAHLLQERSMKGQVQGRSISAPAQPASAAAATAKIAPIEITQPTAEQHVASAKRQISSRPAVTSHIAKASSTDAGVSQTDDSEYVALMFCDPLSCSTDAQVVRMELPATGAADRDAGTQLADVIVGYDGVVRAMRFVNSNSN